jgi:hypothetical protein
MVFTKRDLLAEARGKTTVYERQEDSRRTVRLWGDTAIITALFVGEGFEWTESLLIRNCGSATSTNFTPSGWKYVFAQASIPLPQEE